MTEPPPNLRRFFDSFAPLLELTRDVASVEREIGQSASGSQRLAFYGVLAERSRFLALRDMCPAFRYAALALDQPLWVELVGRYAKCHPPSHRNPNRFAERFAEFVAEERSRGVRVPAYLEELADYEFALWEVGIADFEPTVDDPGLERTIRVRQYTHDVASFVAEFHAEALPLAPIPRPTVVLVYCDVRTGFPRTFFPTAAGIAALARRSGQRIQSGRFDAATLSSAESELVEHGLLLANPS